MAWSSPMTTLPNVQTIDVVTDKAFYPYLLTVTCKFSVPLRDIRQSFNLTDLFTVRSLGSVIARSTRCP